MRKVIPLIVAFVAVYGASAEVNAGLFSECSPCCEVVCDPCESLCGKQSQWEYGGWLETGLYANQYGQRNEYTPRFLPGNSVLLANVQRTDLQMNQTWLYFGKRVNTRRGFDVGGRIDFVYGTDADSLQSSGLEKDKGWGKGDYYAALAQLYGEVGWGDVNVKVGKFLTPMGHEDSRATERFFYSLGYTSFWLPNMHSGVMATWEPSDDFSLFGGWTTGELGFFNNSDDNAALFGGTLALTKRMSITYSALIGQKNRKQEYFAHSLAATIDMTNRLQYTCEWTLRNDSDLNGNYWGGYGINNEFVYCANQKLAYGTRIEWMHAYGNSDLQAANYYGITGGVNWTPTPWLLVRPEVRYDKVFGADPFDGSKKNDEQFSGGASVVVTF